jgi:hypothetical protein
MQSVSAMKALPKQPMPPVMGLRKLEWKGMGDRRLYWLTKEKVLES